MMAVTSMLPATTASSMGVHWLSQIPTPKSIARTEARFDVARPETAGKPYTLKLSR